MSEKGVTCLAKKNLLAGMKQAKVKKCVHCLAGKQKRVSFCYAEFDIIRENINAKNKTTDLRGSPINWLRLREEGEQFYYGEARTELQNRVCHSVYIYRVKLRPNLSVCNGSDSRHSTNLHLDLNSPNRFFRRTMIVPGLPLFLRVAPQGN